LNRLRAESEAREREGAYGFRAEKEDRPANEVKVTVYAVRDLSTSSKRGIRTQFPIFSDRCEYQVLSPPQIAGVPEAHRTIIQEAQPYLWEDGPHFHPLAVLRVLSNKDKHRTLIPTAVIHDIGFVSTTNADTEFTFTLSEGDEVEDGTPVFRFIARPHNPALEMYVQPGVTFNEGVEGTPLLSTLDAIFQYVSYVISRLSYAS
jgi:hypothetical protein